VTALSLIDAGTRRIALRYQTQIIERRCYHIISAEQKDDGNIKLLRHRVEDWRRIYSFFVWYDMMMIQ